MNIIGICGQKNSGKSTVARFIGELVPGTVEIQLAEPLKRFCADVFDWKDDVLNGPSEMREKPDKRYPRREPEVDMGDHVEKGYDTFLTPRFALQRLGTEWGRACYEDVWIDYALRRLGLERPGVAESSAIAVIPDVRFINEARKIREAGGQVWRVRRDNLGVTNANTHASEREQFSNEMDKYVSWDIVNDMDLEALHEAVRARLS